MIYFMNKIRDRISKDVYNICCSFLSENEVIYSEGNWNKFPNNKVCNIAAENDWEELLFWAHTNNKEWNANTFAYAALNGNFEMLEYLHKHGCICNASVYN